MTINEAKERARLIWGESRFFSLKLRDDGGAEITLLRTFLASDGRGRASTWHQLDCNGHAICHVDCEQLEAEHTETAKP